MDENRRDDAYVANTAWRATATRPDAIDDIADQFERRRSGAEAFWTDRETRRGLRRTRSGPRLLERGGT